MHYIILINIRHSIIDLTQNTQQDDDDDEQKKDTFFPHRFT